MSGIRRALNWNDRFWLLAGSAVWILLAAMSYVAGETHGPFIAFLGMFMWLLGIRDEEALYHDMRRALNGWQLTIDALEEEKRKNR